MLFRSAVVVIHAVAGVCGLIAGVAAIAPPRSDDGRAWLRALYLSCLTVVLLALVLLMAIDWNSLDALARGAFGGLAVLAAVMVYRMTRAYEVAGSQAEGWREQYIRHVYFTYIALWEGFVVLPSLRLPYPPLTVPLIAIVVLLVGGTLIDRYKARVLLARPASATTPWVSAARPERGADGGRTQQSRPHVQEG